MRYKHSGILFSDTVRSIIEYLCKIIVIIKEYKIKKRSNKRDNQVDKNTFSS